MGVVIIIWIIVVLTSSLGCMVFRDEYTGHTMCLIVCIFSSVLLGVLTYEYKINENPQAIDVYRGNTTLQITYQDSIPIDSTVVWKQ